MSDQMLIVRYQMFCDDSSGSAADESRLAELVCSLTSVERFIAAVVNVHVVVYTLPVYVHRLTEIVGCFSFAKYSIVELFDTENAIFAETISHCTMVDRLCIRRMLADFSLLPHASFRLLLGTDIIFLKPPAELFTFLEGTDGDQVIYMADTESFAGERYQLPYHQGETVRGLLGDFYCLAPDVSIAREDILTCLTTIDHWPLSGRWNPHPAWMPLAHTHACEQQAASILLANFICKELSPRFYRHVSKPLKADMSFCHLTVLHAHAPWALMLKGALPQSLIDDIRSRWVMLGMVRNVRLSRWRHGILTIAKHTIRYKASALLSRLRRSQA